MTRRIEYYIYTPNVTIGGSNPNSNFCARSLSDGGRSVGFHQCSRKIVSRIDGYGFCKQHYDELVLSLGIETGDGTTRKYVALFHHGSPTLSVIEILKSTKHTITLKSVTNLIGRISLYTGKQNIHSRYTSGMAMFDTKKDALAFLKVKALEYIESLEEKILDVREDIEKYL